MRKATDKILYLNCAMSLRQAYNLLFEYEILLEFENFITQEDTHPMYNWNVGITQVNQEWFFLIEQTSEFAGKEYVNFAWIIAAITE